MNRGGAAVRWAEALAEWRIPEAILDAAPESPWNFPVPLFADIARAAMTDETPSRRRALEALPAGGTVLDVGCGGGAGGLPLAARAGLLVGVDESADMLTAFAAAAAELRVEHLEWQGRWPDVAQEVPVADVVVCHHVCYNVADLVPFARALTTHARRRVVVEMTERHPQSPLNDLWWHFHGLSRPSRPVAGDAFDVLAEAGAKVSFERFTNARRLNRTSPAQLAAFTRRRLCLPPERDEEVAEILARHPDSGLSDLVTLWWDGSATG